MIFNSFTYLFFLPVIFILYWFFNKKSIKFQNILLLLSSYIFYATWNWKFLFLLIFSTLLDYYTGLKMADAKSAGNKRFWFWLSIGANLGFLGVFKYYNFFITSFVEGLNNFGLQANLSTLEIMLPVGISFYTFHGLSYVIDIYKNRIKPEKSFLDYAVFVCFFPLLVAGPIERATHLLPQIKSKRIFSYSKAADGLRQILWGLFMKIVVADNCALIVNDVFKNQSTYNAPSLIIGAVLFAFQIYGDFAGYSNIALGSAKLFGIDLLKNFSFPYFSRDIAEFWRRWHISLSTWFKDYLYIPLGGSKGGKWMQIRNTLIIFVVSGFWHGANWTFVIWGFLNALYIMPLVIFNLNRKNTNTVAENRLLPNFKEFAQIIFTFAITTIAWVFFRSATVSGAFKYLARIFDLNNYAFPQTGLRPFIFVIILILVEWFQRSKDHGLQIAHVKSVVVRWSIYGVLLLLILVFGANSDSFIYFQF